MIVFVLSAVTCAFAEITVRAEVDKKTMTADEVLSYKIVINSSEIRLPPFDIPKFDGFNIISRAQSSQIKAGGGKFSNTTEFVYVLTPVKTGILEIPPIEIKTDKNKYSTESFRIEVKEGKEKPKPQVPPKSVIPEGIGRPSEQTTL